MSRALRVVALVIVALGALASPASAGRVKLAEGESITNVSLAGSQVVYAQRTAGLVDVRAVRPGAASRSLTRFPPMGQSRDDLRGGFAYGLAATPTHLAYSTQQNKLVKGQSARNESTVVAGPLEGPHSTLVVCSPAGTAPPYAFALDGDRVAHVADSCSHRSGDPRILVRNLSAPEDAPPEATIVLGSQARPETVRLAGRYLAYSTGGATGRRIVVYDLPAGAEAYRVEPAGSEYDLQDDGKLVVRDAVAGCSLDWFSPAEPVPHRLEHADACYPLKPHLAGDRVAFAGTGALSLVDLAGSTRRLLAYIGGSLLTGLDFDGERVAYVVGGCHTGGDEVWLDDLGAGRVPERSPRCAVRLSSRVLTTTRGGLVHVGLECPVGCRGRLRAGPLRSHAGARLSSVGRFDGVGRLRVALRLTTAARRLLARRERAKAGLEFEIDDRGLSAANLMTKTVRLK